ncbi:uncharacterized protein BCR38DRAFT_442546 [Pseudomassariella vexata]|uniref:Uncharacterized protein n=1 Tax=Pseudomassariella vexata TaxID=1141098 RepID=A0A1Y2DNQ2_9PEZI|nr:uncharacterized protein BCR38DRAFT_442546 [Pseudomassariella vexata]ORY60794.1 hypothetical protein BCR38DRAFT_442546 [Pseudomassariella vexata]
MPNTNHNIVQYNTNTNTLRYSFLLTSESYLATPRMASLHGNHNSGQSTRRDPQQHHPRAPRPRRPSRARTTSRRSGLSPNTTFSARPVRVELTNLGLVRRRYIIRKPLIRRNCRPAKRRFIQALLYCRSSCVARTVDSRRDKLVVRPLHEGFIDAVEGAGQRGEECPGGPGGLGTGGRVGVGHVRRGVDRGREGEGGKSGSAAGRSRGGRSWCGTAACGRW